MPGLSTATCGTDMHRTAVLGGQARTRHRCGVIRVIDTPTMTRRPAEPRPANAESMEDRTRPLDLRGFIVDPTSAHFDWASAECPKGVRLDRLVSAMVTELIDHRPVALGIMMPTWIPVTHKAAAACAARNLHRDGFLDLHTVFMALRAQVDQLRVFVHWRTFITASGPKLYLWEAFRSEQPAERDLSVLLADSMRAIAAPEPSAAVTTDDVLSLVGALLLRTALTDDVTVLRTPCALVGQPATSDPDELRRDKERRDKELIDFLVRQAMATWFRENGRPEIAKLYARDAASEPSPPPVKRGRKPRA